MLSRKPLNVDICTRSIELSGLTHTTQVGITFTRRGKARTGLGIAVGVALAARKAVAAAVVTEAELFTKSACLHAVTGRVARLSYVIRAGRIVVGLTGVLLYGHLLPNL